MWFDQATFSLTWTPVGPPTLSLLFKVGTDDSVPLLKLHDGSLHGPKSLEGCPTCSPLPPCPTFFLWDTHDCSHLGLSVPPSLRTRFYLWVFAFAVPSGGTPCFAVFTWPVSSCHSYFRKYHCLCSIHSSTCVISSGTLFTLLCFTFFSGLLFNACLPLGCKLNNRDPSTESSAQCIVDAQ